MYMHETKRAMQMRGQAGVYHSIEWKVASAVPLSCCVNGLFIVSNFSFFCVPLSDYPLCYPTSNPPAAKTHTLTSATQCMCVFEG